MEKADKHRHWSLWAAVRFSRGFRISSTRHCGRKKHQPYLSIASQPHHRNPVPQRHTGSLYTNLLFTLSLLHVLPATMGEAIPARKCTGGDCNNDAGSLQCPTCMKLGVKDSFFCAQDCFKRNWVSAVALLYHFVLAKHHLIAGGGNEYTNRFSSPPVLPHADQT
jgi:hypothetical protein